MNVRRPECDEQPFKPTLWNARLNQTTTLSGVIWPPRSERTTYVESAEDLGPEALRPEDLRPEDLRPEDLRPEDLRPEDLRPEDLRPEDLRHAASALARSR